MEKSDLIIKIDKGEKQEELRLDLIDTLNKYVDILTGYEMIGILDVVKMDAHMSIQEMDEEEE